MRVKQTIYKVLGLLVNMTLKTLSYICYFTNYNKPKILVYTDSRGYNVNSKLGKNAYHSYVRYLIFNYRTKFKICPEKYTTIVDFLEFIENIDGLNSYNYIILHCGIVDFSPRPLSNIENVKKSKLGSSSFKLLFQSNKLYHETPFTTKYQNEQTTTLYSIEYLQERIIPKLLNIQNLIWIDSNMKIEGWEGNYSKGRPANFNSVVKTFQQVLTASLKSVISLQNWSDNEIKQYTIDNIHFTTKGFKEIYKLIANQITMK